MARVQVKAPEKRPDLVFVDVTAPTPTNEKVATVSLRVRPPVRYAKLSLIVLALAVSLVIFSTSAPTVYASEHQSVGGYRSDASHWTGKGSNLGGASGLYGAYWSELWWWIQVILSILLLMESTVLLRGILDLLLRII